MKKMRRWLALLAVAALVLSLGGCGGSSGGGSGSSNDDGNDTTTTYHEPTGQSASAEEVAALLDTITDGALQASAASSPTYTVDLGSLTASVSAAGAASTAGSTTLKIIDLVWHVDPSRTDEFYTVGASGNELTSDQMANIQENLDDCAVYIARDIRYANSDWNFNTNVTKDEDNEVGCLYTASGYTNYIFATLPSASDKSAMTHSSTEAYNTPVLHIHKPGTYNLSGTWNGQIWVDAEDDATVTLNLNDLTVNCATGPGLVFCDGLYECDGDADESTASWDVSAKVAKAGANVVLTGDNSVTGCNLYRILKAEAKSGYTADGKNVGYQKKRYKVDGAFHSMVSMNIGGTGSLTVKSTTCEGMDSEMHLTINGGAVTVTAPDDAINVNEDGISVFTMNAGTLTATGTTQEGDGIDSNGYIVINGGTVKATAGGSGGTAGLDADYRGDYDRSYGIYINGGTTTTNGTMGTVYQNGGTLNNTGSSDNGGGGQPGGDQPGGQPGGNQPGGQPGGGNGGPAMHR